MVRFDMSDNGHFLKLLCLPQTFNLNLNEEGLIK